uniref:DNA 5'-3' helicase n=4 Tax=unclassified bacterial viruses TaxID=12333 RepID=A0AAU6W406_9VIRU
MRDPFSIEAEHGLLGALINKPELIDLLSADLKSTDFNWSKNAEIFRAILALAAERKHVDYITVADSIGQMEDGDSALVYCAEISVNTPSTANAQSYANVIRERAIDRQLIAAAQNIHEMAYGTQSTAEKVAAVQAEILSIDSDSATPEVLDIADIMSSHVEELQRREDLGGRMDGLGTGNKKLDEAVCGMKPGQLIVVAGRAKMGKTTFAMGIARHVGIRENKKVLIVSLEMSKTQLMDRILSAEGTIPLSSLKDGTASSRFSFELTSASAVAMRSGLRISDRPGLTISRVRAMARRQKRTHGLDLLMIDHLGLLDGEDPRMNTLQKVSEITRQAKLMANELQIPVILLSQLNRALEQRPNKRPIASDLRDSGSIEQDADIVMFVYRDEVYDPKSQYKGVAEIILGIGRDIEAQTVMVGFEGQYNRFVDLDHNWRPPEPVQDEKEYKPRRGMSF